MPPSAQISRNGDDNEHVVVNNTAPSDVSDKKTPISSDMMARVEETSTEAGKGLSVRGIEDLNYDFVFTNDIFAEKQNVLSNVYKKWGRVLVVADGPVTSLYGEKIKKYFAHHKIEVKLHTMAGGEVNKNMKTMESLVEAFDNFGLIRKEPVLVVGGGLVTDVTGYACSSYRRSSNFIRVSTTLIGLIDASVSIKVGINHKKLKNRLGAYHAPILTVLDFDFLKTLPLGQTRNGFAELVKISAVADRGIWKDLVKYGPELIETRFGRVNGSDELLKVADSICYRAIVLMLKLESPNLHEIRMDRVIAFGHTFSPTLELTPKIPLRHGHAITADMSYAVTLAWLRGYITEEERNEFHDLAYRVKLTMDHPAFDEELLEVAYQAILKTRDGKQWFAEPKPLGTCHFINDASMEELKQALREHKKLIATRYPDFQGGVGVDAFVDASDLGVDPKSLKKEATDAKGENGLLESGGAHDAKKNGVKAQECGC